MVARARVHQHSSAVSDGRALVDALAALYAYAFGVPETVVRIAAEQRALADRRKTRRAGSFIRVIGRRCPTTMTAASFASQGSMAFPDRKPQSPRRGAPIRGLGSRHRPDRPRGPRGP